jgi:hypothetical protein
MEIHHHHHHMALQPNSGPGLPFWGFVTITFLHGWIVSPAPNPEPGGPGLRIYDPRRQGGTAIPPQAPGTHFSSLLRHAWVTVGLFFSLGHHTGDKRKLHCGIKWNEECSKLKMTVFWDVAPMMKAVSTSEMSVNFYWTTRRSIPEDSHLYTRRIGQISQQRSVLWKSPHCSIKTYFCLQVSILLIDRLCGLVVSVEDYKHRGPGFDSWALLRISLRELGLERGPLSLVIG